MLFVNHVPFGTDSYKVALNVANTVLSNINRTFTKLQDNILLGWVPQLSSSIMFSREKEPHTLSHTIRYTDRDFWVTLFDTSNRGQATQRRPLDFNQPENRTTAGLKKHSDNAHRPFTPPDRQDYHSHSQPQPSSVRTSRNFQEQLLSKFHTRDPSVNKQWALW
jgi:hypothetical protein